MMVVHLAPFRLLRPVHARLLSNACARELDSPRDAISMISKKHSDFHRDEDAKRVSKQLTKLSRTIQRR